MLIQKDPFHCLKCKHEWIGEVLVDAPVNVVLAVMRELHCPNCGAGARNVAFGRGDVPNPKPVLSGMTDFERRAAWLRLHDNGLSSECIAEVMCGLVPTGDYPLDGADFGRCYRLLLLYPAWAARLGEMTKVNKHWAALVLRWEEISQAYLHDVELRRTKRAGSWSDGRQCYPLMRSVLDPLEREEAL